LLYSFIHSVLTNVDKNRSGKTHQHLDQDKAPKCRHDVGSGAVHHAAAAKQATAARVIVNDDFARQIIVQVRLHLFRIGFHRRVEQIVDVLEFSRGHRPGGKVTGGCHKGLDDAHRKGQDPSFQGALLARRPPLPAVGKMDLGDVGAPDLRFVRLVVVRLDGQGCGIRHGVVPGFPSPSVAVSPKRSRAVLVGVPLLGLTEAIVVVVDVIAEAAAVCNLHSPVRILDSVHLRIVGIEFDVHQFGGNPPLWFSVALSAVIAHVYVCGVCSRVIILRRKQRYDFLFVFENAAVAVRVCSFFLSFRGAE
jgi:hypothetical protein